MIPYFRSLQDIKIKCETYVEYLPPELLYYIFDCHGQLSIVQVMLKQLHNYICISLKKTMNPNLIFEKPLLQYIAPLNWLTHDIVVENICSKKHSQTLEMLVLSNIEEDETILENGGNQYLKLYNAKILTSFHNR